MNAPRDIPILFVRQMVLKVMANAKSQTRRIVNPQPAGGLPNDQLDGIWLNKPFGGLILPKIKDLPIESPYGRPGDRLYVKETFFAWGYWSIRHNAKKGRPEWHFNDMSAKGGRYRYAADDDHPETIQRCEGVVSWWKRPAIFMPRRASRITLEVTSISVERLLDISESDSLEEGIDEQDVIVGTNCHGGVHCEERGYRYFFDGCDYEGFESASEAYGALWESINGAGSWLADPWVWRIAFKRIAL